jgi:hypothetical protein
MEQRKKQRKMYHYKLSEEPEVNLKDPKVINSLVAEVKRYEFIADYFQKNPTRLTKKNKTYLEGILYRLCDIEGTQLPEQVKEVCSRTLDYLLTKFKGLV